MRNTNWILVVIALATMLLLVGCGGEAENEAASTPAAETGGEAAVQAAEAHDCDGGCGMKAVPMDKLVQVNGKYYCAGCAKKAKEAVEDEAKEAAGDHPHSG